MKYLILVFLLSFGSCTNPVKVESRVTTTAQSQRDTTYLSLDAIDVNWADTTVQIRCVDCDTFLCVSETWLVGTSFKRPVRLLVYNKFDNDSVEIIDEINF